MGDGRRVWQIDSHGQSQTAAATVETDESGEDRVRWRALAVPDWPVAVDVVEDL